VRASAGAFTASYFEPHGGAVGRVGATATAMGGRDAGYGFHVIAGWPDADDDAAVMGWAHAFSKAMAAHATGASTSTSSQMMRTTASLRPSATLDESPP
jgi:hypothetical protein